MIAEIGHESRLGKWRCWHHELLPNWQSGIVNKENIVNSIVNALTLGILLNSQNSLCPVLKTPATHTSVKSDVLDILPSTTPFRFLNHSKATQYALSMLSYSPRICKKGS